jgi:hypothetical protein
MPTTKKKAAKKPSSKKETTQENGGLMTKADWPTVYDLSSDIRNINLEAPAGKSSIKRKKPGHVTDGLTPEPFPMKEGYYVVTPEQVASLEVPVISIGEDRVQGFQRDARDSKVHARNVARALIEGREFPPINVSIVKDENGVDHALVTDGSHRSVGSIIARVPIEVVVKRRTFEQAKVMFTDQRKQRKIKSDQTILTGDSPLEHYIQDALTSDDHPWSDMISPHLAGGDKRRMTPITAAQCIGAYTFDSMNSSLAFYTKASEQGFDLSKPDELVELIQAFGNKTTNPLAFRSRSLKAITYAAVYIFQRNPNTREGDRARWKEHMPKFAFEDYPHLLDKHHQLAQALIEHWNRRLPRNRKVSYDQLTYSR